MKKLTLDELGRLSVDEYHKIPKLPVSIVLEDIRSGLNVGSVFRSADAFMINHIFLTGITPQPPHREILKTAIGATQSVPWTYQKDVVELAEKLKKAGNRIVLVEQTSRSESLENVKFDKSEPIVFVFGNEVNGVSEALLTMADAAIEIPQFGTKHSLNISVAAGIILWQYLCQTELK